MKFSKGFSRLALGGVLITGLLSALIATPSQAATSVPLVLYSAQGYDADMAKAFTAATGIKVNLHDDSTGPILAKIQAEKNNPQWGVLWVDGATAFAALDKQGMLLPYTPKAAFNAVGKSVIPANHSYVPTGVTVMAALIYNASKVSTLPKTYNDLTSAAFKGQLGMNDPTQSGPTFPFIAGMMNQLGGEKGGVAAGEAFYAKLKANGLVVNNTNGDTLHALETGVINMGLIQSSAAEGEVMKIAAKPIAGFTPKVIYLAKSTLLPGVIGIDKGVSKAEQSEAKKFVEFTLSPAGQKVMQGGDPTGDSLYWPVVSGVKALPGLSALPTSYQAIDPYFWGPLQGQVDSWFVANIRK